MSHLSRRKLVALAAAGTATAPLVLWHRQRNDGHGLTARVVVDRIKQSLGVPWKSDTVDTFKAGDPETVVKGVVTTAMATMEVLRQAAKAGPKLVVTCEPTFYGKPDTVTSDPVHAAKNDFINQHNLVVWRFSDHWRLHTPDPLASGLTEALGWSRFKSADDPARLSIPPIKLASLASQIKKALHARGGIRVIGDPETTLEKVALLPGATPLRACLDALPGVDVIVAGEVREWESVELVRDAITAGGRKGLILLGRALSEEPGMQVCARWIKSIVPDVPTTWLSAGDPYWRPI
jgi:putative NIF3 family GTP cyclohydrolase 1 type 2